MKAISCASASASVRVEALTLSMSPLLPCALVPGVHGVEQAVGLVDHQHRSFNPHAQVRAGDDDGDFEQALFFGV